MISKSRAINSVLKGLVDIYKLEELNNTLPVAQRNNKFFGEFNDNSLIDLFKDKSIDNLRYMAKLLGKKRIKKCISLCESTGDNELQKNLTKILSEMNKK